jgi:hypothetical protein
MLAHKFYRQGLEIMQIKCKSLTMPNIFKEIALLAWEENNRKKSSTH